MLTLDGIDCAGLILNREILQRLSNDQGKLNLIADIDTLRPYNWTFPWEEDGARGLQKVERLLRPSAVKLGYVVAKARAVSVSYTVLNTQ